MSEYITIECPWLRCPGCGKIFQGAIVHEKDGAKYTNYCPHCRYKITESIFDEARLERKHKKHK